MNQNILLPAIKQIELFNDGRVTDLGEGKLIQTNCLPGEGLTSPGYFWPRQTTWVVPQRPNQVTRPESKWIQGIGKRFLTQPRKTWPTAMKRTCYSPYLSCRSSLSKNQYRTWTCIDPILQHCRFEAKKSLMVSLSTVEMILLSLKED